MGLDPNYGTLVSLVSMLLGLLGMTYSGDKVALASYAAQDMAAALGVDPAEFERVRRIVVAKWLNIDATDVIHRALSAGGDPNIR